MQFSPTETAIFCAGSMLMGWAACMITGYIRQYLRQRRLNNLWRQLREFDHDEY